MRFLVMFVTAVCVLFLIHEKSKMAGQKDMWPTPLSNGFVLIDRSFSNHE